mgnify:CR=1 FL=1
MIGYDFSELTKKRPEKSLTTMIGRTGGRNNQGRITSRFMAGGHKRLYRVIDFKGYNKVDIPAKVAAVEYDPYRTARIALLYYVDGEKRYVLAWKGAKVGQVVMNGVKGEIAPGNRRQLKDIPEGMTIFNLEVTPFSEGKLIKSAGGFATLAGRDEALRVVFVKMPSGEVRKFNENCWATLGEVSNADHKNEHLTSSEDQTLFLYNKLAFSSLMRSNDLMILLVTIGSMFTIASLAGGVIYWIHNKIQ